MPTPAADGDSHVAIRQTSVGGGWFQGQVRTTPSFVLLYLAIGLLLGEAAIGMTLVARGASLLGRSGSSPSPAPVVPNGPSVGFELESFVTGYVGARSTP
jgi:hypothetical protein